MGLTPGDFHEKARQSERLLLLSNSSYGRGFSRGAF
jgi:hypothetical protein